jgi:Ca2+-binding EF-hand superfamily protein
MKFLACSLAAFLLVSCATQSTGRKEFTTLDSNRDGTVTSAEFSSHITSESFRQLDANGDGRIALAEWQTKETARTAVPLFQALDTSHDGFLEPAEFSSSNKKRAHLENTFHTLDRNGDGGLTWDEATGS